MNIYFLLEDSQSFYNVLPHWLGYVLPGFARAYHFDDFQKDGDRFMIESGHGYPQIKNVIGQTIDTFRENDVPLDYFVICWDTDAKDAADLKEDKDYFSAQFEKHPVHYEYKLLAMNRCFETWLLGNVAAWPKDGPTKLFRPFADFYNVSTDDPEKMPCPPDAVTVSRYHLNYFKTMLKSHKPKKRYAKNQTGEVETETYLQGICSRASTTKDLRSFAEFWLFLQNCRQ